MHYAFGVGDMPGVFTAGTAVRDVFQNLLEQGAVELHPRHRSQDSETRMLTGTYYVLSEDGRNLVDQILRDGMSFKQPIAFREVFLQRLIESPSKNRKSLQS